MLNEQYLWAEMPSCPIVCLVTDGDTVPERKQEAKSISTFSHQKGSIPAQHDDDHLFKLINVHHLRRKTINKCSE